MSLEYAQYNTTRPLRPPGLSHLPTALLTEKFQETGGHLAVLDFGDSLAPTENTMGLKTFYEFAFWKFHNSIFFF